MDMQLSVLYFIQTIKQQQEEKKKKLYTARNEIYLSTIFIDSFSYSLAEECFGACEDSTFSVRYTSVSYVCVHDISIKNNLEEHEYV